MIYISTINDEHVTNQFCLRFRGFLLGLVPLLTNKINFHHFQYVELFL